MPEAAERTGARAPSATAARPPSRVGTWVDHHLYSVVASLGRAWRRPASTLLTCGVMALALALPLGLALVLHNVARLAGDIDAGRQVSVFVKPGTADTRVAELATELQARDDVATVEHRDPARGLELMRGRGGDFGDAIDALGENPLPHVLVVTPAGDEALLADRLRTLPEADLVQHDSEWRRRLDGWLRFGGRVAWVLALLLGVGALLVVGNTVRLDIQSRREEIGVLQLLGATDGFIRRPFVYLGAWYGLLSGLLAIALLAGAGAALRAPVAELAASYGSGYALRGFLPVQAAAVVAGAVVLGWLGAWAVAGHYLRQTRPTET